MKDQGLKRGFEGHWAGEAISSRCHGSSDIFHTKDMIEAIVPMPPLFQVTKCYWGGRTTKFGTTYSRPNCKVATNSEMIRESKRQIKRFSFIVSPTVGHRYWFDNSVCVVPNFLIFLFLPFLQSSVALNTTAIDLIYPSLTRHWIPFINIYKQQFGGRYPLLAWSAHPSEKVRRLIFSW